MCTRQESDSPQEATVPGFRGGVGLDGIITVVWTALLQLLGSVEDSVTKYTGCKPARAHGKLT